MKYFCLCAGVVNTLSALLLVYLAGQIGSTNEIAGCFIVNVVLAVMNICSWFILDWMDIPREIREMIEK